ncbi:MAG: hypothetical protein RL607_1910 [Bacteroidota bacterium]|jgi:hypothetical protein
MKKIVLLVIFGLQLCQAQDTIFVKSPDTFRRNYVEIGFNYPKGNLSNKFVHGVEVGYWLRNRLAKNQYLDYGLELNFLEKPRTISYQYADSLIQFESSRVGLKLGLRYSKVWYQGSNPDGFSLESNSGLGWAALYYKVSSQYPDQFQHDLDKKTDLHTLFASQTVKLNWNRFGFYLTGSFQPYILFYKKNESHFGGTLISWGMVSRF